MSKRKFIFGCTDLAQLLYANLLDLSEREVEAFVAHRKYCYAYELMGLPVVPFEDANELFPPAESACYVCLGYAEMNRPREVIGRLLESRGYEILDFRHPNAFIKADSLGKGNIFFADVFIDFFTALGSFNIFYPKSVLSHHTKIGNYNFFAVSSCVAGHCRIGDGNFIGANATVANNIKIADHSLLGAGAYLYHNLETSQVFAPCRGLILENRMSTDFL